MFKYIILFLVFYFIFRAVRNFFRSLMGPTQRPGGQNPGHAENPNGQQTRNSNAARPKYNIDQNDIVEAQFEELKPDEDQNDKKSDKDGKPEEDNNKK